MNPEIKIDPLAKIVSDAKYSFHFHTILQEYEGKFENLKTTINLSETPVVSSTLIKSRTIVFSKDSTECTIDLPIDIYFDKKNKIIEPSPGSVFQSIRGALDQALDELGRKNHPKD